METRAYEFLRKLLDAPGPSGYERAPAQVWREEAGAFADEVTHDVVGNSFARIKPQGDTENAPKVLLAGHIDEIGFVITHVDREGFLWFAPIGGWDDQIVVGQRLRILGRNGDVIGVVGKKAAHLLKEEDRRRPTRLEDMWIDIGAKDSDDAGGRVEVGDAAVIDSIVVNLTDDFCVARSMDNRVGAFVALEAARLIALERGAADVYAVATAQEEITFGGAYTASFTLTSTVAIAIDVTHATDYPGADKKRDHEVKLRGGPVLSRGATINDGVFFGLRDTAQRLGIETAIQATGRSSGTDADAMIHSGLGTATGVVSIPNRYMHSPNEIVSLSDLDNAAKLIAGFVKTISHESDFRPGSS
ncbi:MAG: M42 family metallopeptidase [Chloroflexia bacterium]|nr:M42 family metallopeptidase [Chloroflexia bacterium]